MAFPDDGPYISRKLRFSGAQRARLRSRFTGDKIATRQFIDELWDTIAPDMPGAGWPDEDFYVLGVQVANILPHMSVGEITAAFPNMQTHALYNPRLASFLFGFGGQEFGRLSDPDAIADMVRQLDTESSYRVAAAVAG